MQTVEDSRLRKEKSDKKPIVGSSPDEIIQIDADLAGLSGALEPISNKDKSTEIETTARRISPRKRPEGAKKAVKSIQASKALNRGACAIEGLVEQSRKRNQISQDSLSVQERNSRNTLVKMPGTDPLLVQGFMDVEQKSVLRKLEGTDERCKS